MKYINKWFQFIKERFNPLTYSMMIFVFFGAHHVIGQNYLKQAVILNFEKLLPLIPLILAIALFFFKLRLYDEIKDTESDAIYHPERPLPRGILKKNDVVKAIKIIIVLEILLFSIYGPWSIISGIIAIMYSLLMYKEFFLSKWLRPKLTMYAITHTFIVFFISVTTFMALFNNFFIKDFPNLLYFSLGGWFLFNIFEFGRKTFTRQEERVGVNSYSKVYGKFGAILLVVFMAVLSILCINKVIFSSTANNYLFLWLGITTVMGMVYTIYNQLYIAKLYRLICSLYIIFTYGTIVFLQTIKS